MSAFRSVRSLRTALDSFWLIPALYVLLALGLAVVLMRWDETDPVELASSIDASSAADALSALAGGMLAFTGFVTSIVLLVIQFGSVEFSPRLLRWFRRDQTLKFALSTFIATFLFALVATTQVGRGTGEFVPTRTLIAALVLTLLSVAMFLVLIDRTANGMRVANVAQRLDVAARHVFDSVYPQTADEVRAAEDTVRSLDAVAAVQVIRNGPVGCVLVAIDREALAGLAGTGDCVLELVHAVGDHVPAEHVLATVYGPAQLSERSVRRAIVLGDERTLDDDPAFAIRMFVDIAIRALSPAVNDPTTAVQVLGRIEDLLRYAAPKHLSVGVVTDGAGTTRLIYPVPSWEDLVELALSEIRNCAARQLQVTRRLRALLETLLEDVPELRRPALQRQLELLDDLVMETFPPEQRPTAMVADRQGLGMSRRARS